MKWKEYKNSATETVQNDFGTSDEIFFLEKLGIWAPALIGTPGHSRLELLLKYQASLPLRERWESISLPRVQEALTQYLKESV